MKYTIAIIILMAIGLYVMNLQLTNAKNKITSLEAEKNALELTVRRVKNAEVEANKTIKSLRKSAESNQSCLDWSHTPVCVESINELQKRHNRNRAN